MQGTAEQNLILVVHRNHNEKLCSALHHVLPQEEVVALEVVRVTTDSSISERHGGQC
jgi:hypothetical protein